MLQIKLTDLIGHIPKEIYPDVSFFINQGDKVTALRNINRLRL